MRILDPLIEAAYVDGNLNGIALVHIKWPSGDVYVHNGVGPQIWDGHTWYGIGELGKFDKIKEGIKAGRMSMSLTTNDHAQIAEVLNDDCVGSEVRVYLAVLSQDKGRIFAAQLMYFGYINSAPVQYSNPGVISIECVGVEHRWNQPKQNTRYTAADQRALHPGDSMFDDVETIAKGPLSSYGASESVGSGRGGKGGRGGVQP